jgi:hypothetical protein
VIYYSQIKDTWNVPRHGENVINPFSRGSPWLNFFSTLCGPLPPTFLNLRAIVKQNNDIPMTTAGTNNNLQETIRYHPDENGIYKNRVVCTLQKRKVKWLISFFVF